MRVAICLSGLIGSTAKGGQGKDIDFKITKKYFEKNLYQKGIKIDYFFHCWKNNFQSDIRELYNPKKFLFEDPIIKEKNLTNKEYGTISKNYSNKKSIEIKSLYEKENHFKYDLIILTRFDILILKRLDLYKIDREKFYVVGPKFHHNNNCKCLFCDELNDKHQLNDFIFISNSLNINKFSLSYDYLKEYGLSSNHIITKKHILKMDLWKIIDYVFSVPTYKYPYIWNFLEKIKLFPRGMVPVDIYKIDVPLIRWVHKSNYLKFLDFAIFKLKIDIFYFHTMYRPIRFYKSIPKRISKIFGSEGGI